MKAKIILKQGKVIPNGTEGRLILCEGANGTGEELWAVTFWPWSKGSVDAAYNYIYACAERAGVEIVEDLTPSFCACFGRRGNAGSAQ